MDLVLHLRKGRYLARIATGPVDIARAKALRRLCFGPDDSDDFDGLCRHILIEDLTGKAIVGCCRVLPIADGADILNSYSAQFYDLSALTRFTGPILEIGRFCLHPQHHDPDIFRVAWGALTQWVDGAGIRLLFGCSSFSGENVEPYRDAFRLLYSKHRAPQEWGPKPKATDVFDFAANCDGRSYDTHRAQTALPPLLRTYLLMGGWVSDHAVFDRKLHTMHVFTGVEIAAIPPARVRLLRAVAG